MPKLRIAAATSKLPERPISGKSTVLLAKLNLPTLAFIDSN
jgi:hypothetical protein